VIELFVFFGKRILLGVFLWNRCFCMYLLYPLVPGICLYRSIFFEQYFGFFEKTKIVLFTVAEACFEYLSLFSPYDDLRL
jgi:hypothetical protein